MESPHVGDLPEFVVQPSNKQHDSIDSANENNSETDLADEIEPEVDLINEKQTTDQVAHQDGDGLPESTNEPLHSEKSTNGKLTSKLSEKEDELSNHPSGFKKPSSSSSSDFEDEIDLEKAFEEFDEDLINLIEKEMKESVNIKEKSPVREQIIRYHKHKRKDNSQDAVQSDQYTQQREAKDEL